MASAARYYNVVAKPQRLAGLMLLLLAGTLTAVVQADRAGRAQVQNDFRSGLEHLTGELRCEKEACSYSLQVTTSGNDMEKKRVNLQGLPVAIAEKGEWVSLLPCRPPIPLSGVDDRLGGTFLGWKVDMCSKSSNATKLGISIRNFAPRLVVFSYEYLTDTYPGLGDQEKLLGSFPAFYAGSDSGLDGRLSWGGSFVQPEFKECAQGTQGGPCVMYNAQDPMHGTAIVFSALDNFPTTSRKSGDSSHIFPELFSTRNTSKVAWAGGTVGSIQFVPRGFAHSFVAFLGNDGITETMHGWGHMLRRFHGTHRVRDITIEALGYQTDNGAQYCFGCGDGCDSVLLDELGDLQAHDIPVRYLSYQNAWWHTSGSAPWCVSDWDAVPAKVPMGIPEFHRRAKMPFQLYAPYFCTNSRYASMFAMLSSNASLPACDGFNFKVPAPDESARFYEWFFQLGQTYGMKSYELDFVNQNFNCVQEFLTKLGAAEMFFDGLANEALSQSISVQWCYASPSAVLQALKYPAVTNMRGSFDYFYGRSWDIGGSSLLMWALAQAPSTDTFWTSDNGGAAETMGGCDRKHGCPEDHLDPGCALHTLLALMSTGPVGFSDAKGFTNRRRIRRTCRDDGVLLKPDKPLTTIDAQLSFEGHRSEYSLLHTYSGPSISEVWAWYIVAHHLNKVSGAMLRLDNLWPRLDPRGGDAVWLIRQDVASETQGNKTIYGPARGCLVDGGPLDKCAQMITLADTFLKLEQTSSPFQPRLFTLSPICLETGWAVLGEVEKMAALSTARFISIVCKSRNADLPLGGMAIKLKGSPGEQVTIVFAGPKRQNDDAGKVRRPSAVYVKSVTIPTAGSLSNSGEVVYATEILINSLYGTSSSGHAFHLSELAQES